MAESWKRDHKGEDSEVRLCLPNEEYTDQSEAKYMNQASASHPEAMKNPTQDEARALTMHVHAKANALNFQHSFFHGGCGVPFLQSGTDGIDEDCAGDEEETEQAKGAAEPPLKKLKGNIVKLRNSFNETMHKTMCAVLFLLSLAGGALVHILCSV